jgi:N-ethylmaleimide reductase
MTESLLFSALEAGHMKLKNRTVMAPMTRSRATGNVPNELMVEYYRQRAGAGLIITEGTSPSPNGLGYARIPGIFNQAQIDGWKKVTDAVHAEGGHMFVQLMHTGRVGHPLNLPEGAELVAPSAIAAPGEMYTDQKGMQPHPAPRELTAADLVQTLEEFVRASKNAVAAGFDGVELHGANGYLLEQFLNPHTNQRSDAYGGSVDNRIRFVVEVATRVAAAIGKEKVGLRLSPYGVNAGMAPYEETDETHLALVSRLAPVGLLYVHVVDHSAMGAPKVPASLKAEMRKGWPGLFIASGGFDRDTAEAVLKDKMADLVAFGRPFLSNPDLVKRMQGALPLDSPDFATFYTPGPKGYTDYPVAM